eukprot:CAMPEP_0117554150 /NCGR_PEP_ID=MMETSP0784-20121206/50604_1 /TAXON_ID=39447 /ORGANISM="" /LENGTH=179 /DNA_ID=CAMNT_0005351303 /DNA_START=128 /DNA_END=663 /DNA_ORIENTATION=+
MAAASTVVPHAAGAGGRAASATAGTGAGDRCHRTAASMAPPRAWRRSRLPSFCRHAGGMGNAIRRPNRRGRHTLQPWLLPRAPLLLLFPRYPRQSNGAGGVVHGILTQTGDDSRMIGVVTNRPVIHPIVVVFHAIERHVTAAAGPTTPWAGVLRGLAPLAGEPPSPGAKQTALAGRAVA